MQTIEAQDMSTPEARAAYYESCWSAAAEAGNKARGILHRLLTAQQLPAHEIPVVRELLSPYAMPVSEPFIPQPSDFAELREACGCDEWRDWPITESPEFTIETVLRLVCENHPTWKFRLIKRTVIQEILEPK